MTSRHLARQHHDTNSRSEETLKRSHGMANPTDLQMTLGTPAANSDYGSDLEVHSTVASNYGSDFDAEEETLIGDLLAQIASKAPLEVQKTFVYPSIEEGNNESQPSVLLHSSPPSAVVRLQKGAVVELSPQRADCQASVEVEYDRPSRESWCVPQELPPQRRRDKTALPEANPTPEYHSTDAQPDTRAPLERFRTKPKKPLSVTDLVSPAWCELQYWYVLTKFGRKPQTQAMKQGSKVHRELEEQVHKIIPIQVQSKEDRFGLRIWNTIQGLRTLRETGLTRELEVWGVADGQVINGIIDEISYTCPDPDLEEKLKKAKMEEGSEALPLGQLKIEQAFANAGLNEDTWVRIPDAERVVYLADVKTRGAKSVPAGASLRPTWMQLMLYRRLLEALALNTVDAETIFARYNVQPLEPFTETFIREVGALDGRAFDTEQEALHASELYAHNTLLSLWSLMIHEFSLSTTTFSDVLRAEFRFSKTGELIGSEVFAYDTKAIEAYIASEMSWWKGERAAKGVEVEEAFKCRMCDFANECSWRKDKVHEATEKHRLRAAERKKSAV